MSFFTIIINELVFKILKYTLKWNGELSNIKSNFCTIPQLFDRQEAYLTAGSLVGW